MVHGKFNSLEALREAIAKQEADRVKKMHEVAHSFDNGDPRVEGDGTHICPWCGDDLHCTLVEYDDYLGEHVLECNIWLAENAR